MTSMLGGAGGKKGGAKQRVVAYFMSIHYGICAGPVDKLLRVFFGEKEGWSGPVVAQAEIKVDAPDLMGGAAKEGGVSGVMHYLPGAADQEMPEALASRLGLTTDTCPGFRALASLFFVGPPSSGLFATEGFYWSSNSPYLRGIWAELQCIENHPNSYAWYPAKAAIPRIEDPVSEEEQEAIDNPRGSNYTNDKTASSNSFVVVDGVTGNDWTKWDTWGNYAVRAEFGQVEDNFQIWTLPDGDVINAGDGDSAGVHITRDGEIVIRGYTDGFFKFYDALGTLVQSVDGGTVGQLGGVTFHTRMDDIAITGAGTYLLAISVAPFSTTAYVRLKREGVDWIKEDDRLSTYITATIALGPDYGYGVAVSDWAQAVATSGAEVSSSVVRIALFTLAETLVDLSTLDADIVNIAAVGYDRDNDAVIVACTNGDLYALTPDLSAITASRKDNAGLALARDGLLSKRMMVGASMIALRNNPQSGTGDALDVFKFSTPDLNLVQTLDASEIGFPAYDQGTPLSGITWFQGNNEKWNGAFFPTHFRKSPFWFLGPQPRSDMNPAHIILEALTNKRWGMGQPLASLDLDAFVAAADTLYDEGLGLSMMWTRQATIEKFVSEVLDHIQATLYIAPQTGLLTLKLIRDDYDPDDLEIYDEDNSTVIEFQRKSMADIINELVVSYTAPENEKAKTVTRQDLAGIAAQGGIVSDSRDYYGVRSATLAARLADRDLRAGGYPIAVAILEANRKGWDLVPGQVIKVSDAEHGISQLVMRILSVDYGRPTEPRVRLELAEDVFALEVAEFVQPPTGRWVDPDENPQPMDYTKFMTAPYMALAQAGVAADLEYPETYVGVLAATGGRDTSTYDLYGTVTDAAGVSRLQYLGVNTVLATAKLGAAIEAEVETELVLSTLNNVTQGVTAAAGGFVLIGDSSEEGDELALITQVFKGVATLQRGILDTVPRARGIGRTIVFFRTSDRIYDPTTRSVGESTRYKLLSRTSRGVLSAADAPVVPAGPYIVTDRSYLPLRPANVKVDGVAFDALDISNQSPAVTEFEVTWARRNRLTEDSQPLAWDAADVPPESSQLTRVNILDGDSRAVLAVFDNIAGTSQVVELADFQTGHSPPPPVVIVQVQAINTSVSPPMVSLQWHEITVVVDPGVDALSITGTPTLTGEVGIAYDSFLVAVTGGAPPYAFTLEGDWPPGLEIFQDGSPSALIFGTPTVAGVFATPGITVRVTDALGDTDELTPFVIVIEDEDTTPPTLTNPTGGDVP